MPIISTERRDDSFVPDEDVTETLPDGRQIQVAVKGQPMPRAAAQAAGLLPDPNAPSTGPRETKEGARRPASRKEPAAPTEQDAAEETPPRSGANAPARPPVPGAAPGEAAP